MPSAFDGYENLPRFEDGRIDYTYSKSAPIVSCVIMYSDMILLVKRSENVAHYKNKWDIITGYMDDPRLSVEEHAMIELEEEVRVPRSSISEIMVGKAHRYFDKVLGKTWMVHPVLIKLRERPAIKLNNENVDYKWIILEDLPRYDTVSDLAENIRNTLA